MNRIAVFAASDLKLTFDQPSVEALGSDQLVVCAGLDDSTPVEDDDLVRIFNGAQPVGDDQCGAAYHQAFQRLLYQVLTLGVQGAGRFVE